MEFSSLEHELARATGTPYRSRDNRLASSQHSSMVENCNFHPSSYVTSPTTQSGKNSRRSSLNNNNNNNISSASNLPFSPKKLARNRKLKEYLRTNPSQIDIEEMDYENLEIFDIFFSHDDKDETGEDVLGEHSSPSKGRFSKDCSRKEGESSSSSTDEENTSDSRTDEDPCIIKDRKPEFSKGKSGKSKPKKSKNSSFSNANHALSSIEDSKSKSNLKNGCVCGSDMVDSSKVESSSSSSEDGSPSTVVKIHLQNSSAVAPSSSSRFLELPARIPSDDDDEASQSSGISSAVGDEESSSEPQNCEGKDKDEMVLEKDQEKLSKGSLMVRGMNAYYYYCHLTVKWDSLVKY
jgi:hypothetical protein